MGSTLRARFSFWTPYVSRAYGFSENYKDDLLWLITLRAIKVRDSLHSWGYIALDRCAKCNLKETIDHCLCSVKRVCHRLSATLSALLSSTLFVIACLFSFFNWQTTNQKNARIAHDLVKSILYGIWKFRNKCTFYNGTERSDAIIRYVIQDVKARINIDFFRFSLESFKNGWEFPLCSIISDLLVVKFL